MPRLIAAMFALVAILGLIGCASPAANTLSEPNLKIISVLSSLGGDEQETVYTYQLTLNTSAKDDINIDWIEPILGTQAAAHVTTRDRRVMVGKIIHPGGSLEVSGELRFGSPAIPKAQVKDLEPFITSFHVSSTWTLPMPGTP